MADPQVKNLAYQALGASLAQTAANPVTSLRQVEMKPTPRSPRMGMFADAMMAVRDFANRLQIPQGVPLIGGEGVGSLLMGRAPEELVEMSYGNMPVRVNPYAGRTAGFMPEMKPGRSAQVADLLSLAGVPGGGRTAAAAMGAADLGSGAERALIGYHGTPHRFAPTPANPLGEFQASKINTGEGAQAYGYGTYFAESPAIATSYRDVLGSPRNMVARRRGVYIEPSPIGEGKYMLAVRSETGKMVGQSGDSTQFIYNEREFNSLADAIKFAKKKGLISRDGRPQLVSINEDGKYVPITKAADVEEPQYSQFIVADRGSLYTVDIPDEMIGKMLDYDAPLTQQPDAVRKAIADAQAIGMFKNIDDRATGEQIYNSAIAESGGAQSGAEASRLLREIGIPGIRYLDQGSRPLASDAYAGLQRAQAKVARLESEFAKAPSPSLKSRLEDARQELQSAERGVGDLSRNIVVFPGEESKVKILSRE